MMTFSVSTLVTAAISLSEDRGLTPRREQVERNRAFTSGRGVLGVHVHAEVAPVVLTRTERHQFLRRGRQRGALDDLAWRNRPLRELNGEQIVKEFEACVHEGAPLPL
jgi:hypothetical protein